MPENLKIKIADSIDGRLSEEKLPEIRRAIVEYLTTIIKKSSMAQTLKGVKTTGLYKSLKYGIAKLKKGQKKK